jgi:hypothetical protein
VSREDRGGVATVTAAARHLRSRRSTAPTPLRMRKASALRPVAPKRRTTRPLQKRYRSASPVDPPAEAVGPIRSGISARPDVATGAHAPPREHGTTTRPRRKSHHGDGCPEALRSMLHDRGRRERATRTSGRLPGHRRVRSTRAEASAETAHQLPDGCPVSESAEPSPAEASSNPAPTNPGRGARSAPNASPPAAEAEEDVTSSESRTGCLVVATPHPPQPKPRRMPRAWQLPDGCPVVTHAPTSAAEAEEAVTRTASGRCPVITPLGLSDRSRKRRHGSKFRTCPRSRSPSSRSQRTATRRDVDTGRRRGHAPEAEAPNTLTLDHPTPARAVQLPATEAVGVHRIQPTWKSTSIMRP